MIPLKLKLTAFESYLNTAEIDFTKLDKLYLIHGETGAGKTAILDAMTYSLYGETSGGERTNIRCADKRAEKIPTETEFIFAIKGKNYKFTRTIRITKSGKEDTKQDCFFQSSNGEWMPFFDNPKQNAVKSKAIELTGLTSEQFRQVIILPQGKFEKLLTSDSAEKEKILSTLFNADKYSKLSAELYNLADEEKRRLSIQKAIIESALKAYNVNNFNELSALCDEKKSELNSISEQKNALTKELTEKNKQLEAEQKTVEKFKQLDMVKKSLDEINLKKQLYDNMALQLKKSDRASKVAPFYNNYKNALTSEQQRQTNYKQLETLQKELNGKLETIEKEEQELKQSEEKYLFGKQEITRLSSLSEYYKKADTADKLSKHHKELLEFAKSQLNQESANKNYIEEKINELSAQKENILNNYSSKLENLKLQLDLLEKGKKSADNIKKYKSALNELEKTHQENLKKLATLESNCNSLRQKYDATLKAYIKSIASKLSEQLEDGKPCPVCGSIHHPLPAPEKSAINENYLDKISAEIKDAENNLLQFKDEDNKLSARIDNGYNEIQKEQKIVDSSGFTENKFAEVSKQYNLCCSKNNELIDIDKTIVKFEKQITALKPIIDKLNTEVNTEQVQFELNNSKMIEYTSRLDRNIADLQMLNRVIKDHTTYTEDYEKQQENIVKAKDLLSQKIIAVNANYATSADELKKAMKTSSEALTQYNESLKVNGFVSQDDYTSSLMTEENYNLYNKKYTEYKENLLHLNSSLKELEKVTSGLKKTDIEPLLNNIQQLEKERELIISSEAVAMQEITKLNKTIREYEVQSKKYNADKAKNDHQINFAQMMRGDKGLSFTRYVLGVMLSAITQKANILLRDVHGGQFSLKRKTDGDLRSKQGLELEVVSALSSEEMEYSVKNLSGGEKFIISLALSMALTETIQSQSGGISIEAMFIDEGFGSLDPRTLREAVDILCRINKTRNSIGIISHVKELNEIIPRCIEVTKDSRGSKISY